MRALHRFVMAWPDGASLDLEWADGREGSAVVIPDKSGLAACYDEAAADLLAVAGMPAIAWRPGDEGLFEPLQLREDTEYLVDLLVPCSADLGRVEWSSDPTWPLSPRLSGFYRSDPPKRWESLGSLLRISGRLNFRSYVGIADLGTGYGRSLRVEVAPRKIGYFADYKSLLEVIANELVELLLQVDAPTGLRFGLTDSAVADPKILLFHLRRLMADGWLPSAVEWILRRPHSAIRALEDQTPTYSVQHPAPDLIASRVTGAATMGGPLRRLFRGVTPSTLPEIIKTESVDTGENRYVRAFLEQLLLQCEELRVRLERAKLLNSAREVEAWTRHLQDWLTEPVWRDVGIMRSFPSNSQVLQRREGYRDILAADLVLQYGIELPWQRGVELADGLDGDIRPVSELYQYWCFFVLMGVLQTICGSSKQTGSLFSRTSHGLRINLRHGTRSRIEYSYQGSGTDTTSVTLFYNRTFTNAEVEEGVWSGSYSALFRPDYSILVTSSSDDGTVRRHWLHFDAKYRMDFEEWKSGTEGRMASIELSIESELGEPVGELPVLRERYKRANLDEMHSYRDGVLGTRGAYVLFPGTGASEDLFIRVPGATYPDSRFHLPGVGAFQLSPRATSRADQAKALESFISRALALFASGADYQEETGYV